MSDEHESQRAAEVLAETSESPRVATFAAMCEALDIHLRAPIKR